MSESTNRTGQRLGPYHLERRYEDLEEPGGHLYAAHHVETGRPALVLVPAPGERWAPRSDWSARVTAQSDPPFVAVQLERPPPPEAAALTDVDLAFIRMAGGIASVEDRQEANVHFTQAPAPDCGHAQAPSRWRHVGMGALVAAVLGLGALMLWPCLPGSSRKAVETTATSRAEPTTWLEPSEHPSGMGYPMPETAYPEQMKPPCKRGHVEIRGGCWGQLKNDAPCAEDFAEHEGKCYVPVREKKPVPRSLGH